jgi:hypothetical protein
MDITNKKLLIIGGVLLIISSAYMAGYALYFREYTRITYVLRYSLMHMFLARPLFYLALSFVLGRLLLSVTIFSVAKQYIPYALYGFFSALFIYMVLLLVFFSGLLPDLRLQMLFLLDSPLLYIVLGSTLSVAILKEK